MGKQFGNAGTDYIEGIWPSVVIICMPSVAFRIPLILAELLCSTMEKMYLLQSLTLQVTPFGHATYFAPVPQVPATKLSWIMMAIRMLLAHFQEQLRLVIFNSLPTIRYVPCQMRFGRKLPRSEKFRACSGSCLAADSNGDVVVAGTFNNTVTSGSNTLTSYGGRDVFYG
ncbi:MAG: hypothetical protein IPP71_18405 [Bacteroidetes bacterium]|nr:hypothetical protein [Bacteroidota bacterium]